MYSRSERKFLNPEKDQANPNLGPGCYTRDETVLLAGKVYGSNGYAPFSSLAPRISVFEQQVTKGPPPGNYDLSFGLDLTHKTEGGSLFGRSKTQRFKNSATSAPGPGAYVIPSSLHKAKEAQRRDAKRPIGFGLNQKPVAEEISSVARMGDAESLYEASLDHNSAPAAAEQEYMAGAETGVSSVIPVSLVPQPHGETDASARSKKTIKTLVWRRKHVPPSIPKGSNIYGYQENNEGEMEPRKPPKFKPEEAPSFLFSFAELNRYKRRGQAFAKGRERLTFKESTNPGPNNYDPQIGEKFLRGKSSWNNPALMTLAPCKRITDDIITSSAKAGIPGPGSYDIKAPITAKLAEPRNRIKFGVSRGSGYLNADLMKVPGPGAYFPENTMEKPHSHKPKPFGSSTKRFTETDELLRSQPSVGSYEIDDIDSIYQRAKKKNQHYAGQPRPVFGSVSDRFVDKPKSQQPGPGAYDLDAKSKNPKKEGAEKMAPVSRKAGLFHSSPDEWHTKFHVPVFGTQTNRFEDKVEDLPPPGAYNLLESFQSLQTKGRLATSGLLHSQTKREIFKVNQEMPGPGEYVPVPEAKRDIRKAVGAFLSTGTRFTDKHESLPGPGAYMAETAGLLKKTYNVSFGDALAH
ncbi:Sperm-tail PG-rich repeat-containing protein 2 [Kappamyces sp. JEL0829]|nr:Sperm-tail PG-rich repeat-containing protein 2 [Kappamyces sp. JEL0829]